MGCSCARRRRSGGSQLTAPALANEVRARATHGRRFGRAVLGRSALLGYGTGVSFEWQTRVKDERRRKRALAQVRQRSPQVQLRLRWRYFSSSCQSLPNGPTTRSRVQGLLCCCAPARSRLLPSPSCSKRGPRLGVERGLFSALFNASSALGKIARTCTCSLTTPRSTVRAVRGRSWETCASPAFSAWPLISTTLFASTLLAAFDSKRRLDSVCLTTAGSWEDRNSRSADEGRIARDFHC